MSISRRFPASVLWLALVWLATNTTLAATASGATVLPASQAFNVTATVIFGLAILHTFLASRFMQIAHRLAHKHRERVLEKSTATEAAEPQDSKTEVSFKAEMFHFLGEIELVFGLWLVPLFVVMLGFYGWEHSASYLNSLNFTEPLFVLVIMSIAATRPVLTFAQASMAALARLGRSSVAAWWLSILTIGPLLGSFITEPAAMTISALLLGERFFVRAPSAKLAYATLGLLFVNVSIGGTLTHFAAPPVLMVAGKWDWSTPYMLTHFGWKAALTIVISNLLFYSYFRKEFLVLSHLSGTDTEVRTAQRRLPKRIIVIHLLFLVWTVLTNHYPVLFMGGFFFFLGFTQATAHHQEEIKLRTPLLVAFFLAGLVVHGGLQRWWIEPVLARLTERPLFFGSIVLTAFNDNAAITYLASLVPNLTENLKYAVVAGAVVGGGLTVIANAPNPAGVSLLGRYFNDSVSPLGLACGALVPTAIAALIFLLL